MNEIALRENLESPAREGSISKSVTIEESPSMDIIVGNNFIEASSVERDKMKACTKGNRSKKNWADMAGSCSKVVKKLIFPPLPCVDLSTN